jgi:DNA processing protein
MSEQILYQIALTQIPNIGAVQAKLLLDHFGEAKTIFRAKLSTLEKIEGIGSVRAGFIKSFEDYSRAEEEMAFIEKYKITPLFIQADDYPQRLLHCYDAPTMLYYRGSADLNNSKVISIIGTRSNTDYGKQFTETLIAALQPLNVLVVSGLAYGIDAIAHKSAVQQQLSTVGVLAHGLDSIYPPAHKKLAKDMLQTNGGLLTEFMSNTLPGKHNFPRRNRVVAGMADCTIVIETALKGGSMITAELANGYNRDVFAVPGKVYDNKSEGCNYLIKANKAILLTDAHQLMETMGWLEKKLTPKPQKELFITLSSEEKVLVDILKQQDTTHIDEIYLKSGLNSSLVASAMLSLELQNVVVSLPGKMYRLT